MQVRNYCMVPSIMRTNFNFFKIVLSYRILACVLHTDALPRKNIKQMINRGHSLMDRDFLATLQ
jgi:hypothetical protein